MDLVDQWVLLTIVISVSVAFVYGVGSAITSDGRSQNKEVAQTHDW